MAKYYNESIETASRDKLAALQSERLVKTVKRVYDNVPAYRKKMDDIGLKPEDIKSVDDLSKLPFTYKQDLRDNYPYGLFACPMRDVVRIHASSGHNRQADGCGLYRKRPQYVGGMCGTCHRCCRRHAR